MAVSPLALKSEAKVSLKSTGELEFGPSLLPEASLNAQQCYTLSGEALEEHVSVEPVPGTLWLENFETPATSALKTMLDLHQIRGALNMAPILDSEPKGKGRAVEPSAPEVNGSGRDSHENKSSTLERSSDSLSSRSGRASCYLSNCLQSLVNVSKDSLSLTRFGEETWQLEFVSDSVVPFYVHVLPLSTMQLTGNRLRFSSLEPSFGSFFVKGWSFENDDSQSALLSKHFYSEKTVLEGFACSYGPFAAQPGQVIRVEIPKFSSQNLESSTFPTVRRGDKHLYWPLHIVLQAVSCVHLNSFPSYAEAKEALLTKNKVPESVIADAAFSSALLNWSEALLNVQVWSCTLHTLDNSSSARSIKIKTAQVNAFHLSSIHSNQQSSWPKQVTLLDVYDLAEEVLPSSPDSGQGPAVTPIHSVANSLSAVPYLEQTFHSLKSSLAYISRSLSAVDPQQQNAGDDCGDGSLPRLSKPQDSQACLSIVIHPANRVMETIDGKSQDCVICLSNPSQVLLLPCKHFCVCSDCGFLLRSQSIEKKQLQQSNPLADVDASRCPVCRTSISSLINFILSN